MILTKVKNEVGATAIEYGILSALIAVTTITAMQLTGVKLNKTYCVVASELSKAVGGSGGGCSATPSNSSGSRSGSPAGSGSGSSGTGGTTESAGSSTGSVNSTNSLADGANIQQVVDGLQDELTTAYIPNTYRNGENHPTEMTFGALNIRYSDAMPALAQALKGLNDKDPITNVFNTYHRVGTPITDYSTVYERLKDGGQTLKAGINPGIEVTTASGKVYHLSTFNGHVLGPTENNPKKPQ